MGDFSMFAGDTKILAVAVTDENGAPVNLTGAAIRWWLGDAPDGEPEIEKAVGTGIEVTDAEGGLFEVTLLSADTEDLAGSFYHEAEIIDAAGRVSTVLTGTPTILPTLIKPAD